jgi:hypothetical protein
MLRTAAAIVPTFRSVAWEAAANDVGRTLLEASLPRAPEALH